MITFIICFYSCSDDYLNEKPLDSYSPENIFVDKNGFDAVLVTLYNRVREEVGQAVQVLQTGTDICCFGAPDTRYLNDYSIVNSQYSAIAAYWTWAYSDMLKNCNLIISRAGNKDINWTEDEKNEVLAEAKFFRAYTYNGLVNVYGGVPIIQQELLEPKYDFVRATRSEVLEFVKNDLEFAVLYLPVVSNDLHKEGRIFKAAAAHLLTEVYISLGLENNDNTAFDKAISYATNIINGTYGNYKLMTERFGGLSRPGNAYSDLFWTGQQKRASGNLETIWAIQYEYLTLGGANNQNCDLRWWGPKFESTVGPDGKFSILVCDSLGRSQGGSRPTYHFFQTIWEDDWNDMRNSEYCIRRKWFVNNPQSIYFKQEYKTVMKNGKVYAAFPNGTASTFSVDTSQNFFPMIRKIEGEMPWGGAQGRTPNDQYKMRLAETYLLRAEAYFHKGDLVNAATDINVVRNRAKAKPVTPDKINIDYILDERARELIAEEKRRQTLVRLGLLYKRTLKYNPKVKNNIQPFNELWPIPQSVIDANRGAVLVQNPGY
jgi:hypothetical protein